MHEGLRSALELHTVRVDDGSLAPLAAMQKLRWLCENCDGERLAKHVAAFETLRAGAGSA